MWKFILIVGIIVLAGALIYSSLLRNRPIALGMAATADTTPTTSSDTTTPSSGAVYEVESEEDLQKLLQTSDRVALLLFVDWCGYCKRMKPEFASAAAKGLKTPCIWAQMNAENVPSVARRLQVEAYPTTIVFDRGQVKEVISGAQSQEALSARMESL